MGRSACEPVGPVQDILFGGLSLGKRNKAFLSPTTRWARRLMSVQSEPRCPVSAGLAFIRDLVRVGGRHLGRAGRERQPAR
ncbi:hypothetical protein EDD27_2718 [Nonomuraea polychroma]|uniref:Uncharacterized protein n=1 Tax=Nonomuraea polychroma TaxID=46176 RepID=A0A438M4H6_9ACTN|nr:hypothetical protein EDD27_2718 [Nonomuraea polychroma]